MASNGKKKASANGKKTAKKSPKKSPKLKQPPKVVPKHGRGMIYQGGVPGNRGGTRPRSAVKAAALKAFDKRIGILEDIADADGSEEDKDKARDVDRISAIRVLGQAGGVNAEGVIDKDLIRELSAVIDVRVEDVEAKQAIFDDWAQILGRVAAGE